MSVNQRLLEIKECAVEGYQPCIDYNEWRVAILRYWELSPEAIIEVLRSEPPGLTMGKVSLNDGEWVFGILGEPYICKGMQEITKWGGFRKYLIDQRLATELE